MGLGLTVSRRLAELMGGSLTYRHQDDSSVFEVALLSAEDPDLIAGGGANLVGDRYAKST